MPGSIEKNQEKKIILYLYLIHHPDHGYAIAKEFSDARKNNNWNKKKYSDLSNYKVYTTLKEMHKEGIIFAEKKETTNQDKKERINIYKPSITCITRQKNKETLLEFLELFMDYVAAASPDKQRCIKEINSIKTYDDLTILCYLKKLIRDVLDHSVSTAGIHTRENSGPFGELDEIMKLSGEIVKTKKSPAFLKAIGAADTLSFFRDETRKRNMPLHIENQRALQQTLEDALKKIDDAIITYSYSERIPAKQQ